MLETGQILGDRYRVDYRIAAGGMGEVWQATDTVLGRSVAVKVLHPARGGDPQFQERFRHEARAMAALRHPGVADVYDYGETGEDRYIVMAHIDGQSLDRRIAEAGRLDPATTLSIVAQAARALHAAHNAGIVHRDVKPGNLITKQDGTVVLVDFGVARSPQSSTVTGAHEVVGTAQYLAPERVSKRETGPPIDIYALGAVAYECLAGRPPFLGADPVAVAMQHLKDDPPSLPADVPQPVRDLVGTAMAKNPAKRFPSAAAMAEAAETIAARAGDTVAVRVAAPAPAVRPTRRPSRRTLAAGVLAMLAGLALAIALVLAATGSLLPGGPHSSASTPTVSGGSAGVGGDRAPSAAPSAGSPGQGGSRPPGATPAPGGGNPGGGGPGPTPTRLPNPTLPLPTLPLPTLPLPALTANAVPTGTNR